MKGHTGICPFSILVVGVLGCYEYQQCESSIRKTMRHLSGFVKTGFIAVSELFGKLGLIRT